MIQEINGDTSNPKNHEDNFKTPFVGMTFENDGRSSKLL